MTSDAGRMANQAALVTEQIRPLLAGLEPGVVSAVLADLLSMWLAGHMGDDATKVRANLLADHVALVLRLVPVNEAMILERLRRTSN